MHIIGLCGSLRRDSHNRRLLAAATKLLPQSATFQMFDEIAGVPPYDQDTDGRDAPAVVRVLRGGIAAADGVLIATPEYNASVPGVLKNALDWASRPYPDHSLREKPVLVMGASPGAFGATLAQAELRRVLKAMGADVIEMELSVAHAHEAFAPDGGLHDPRLRAELADIVNRLIDAASSRRALGRSDDDAGGRQRTTTDPTMPGWREQW